MRWIDLDKIQLPEGWLAKAAAAKRRVAAENLNPEELSDVWRCLKDNFASLSDKRCWICEAPSARADNAIDHFRPKNRVAEGRPNNSGYRWLAFDYTNFRYICTFCNSLRVDQIGDTRGGKADRFPLRDEAARAYSDTDDVFNEQPMLLDPCDASDWKLLGCSVESGAPVAATDDPDDAQRVTVSIEVYHLHQDALNKLRLTRLRDLDQKVRTAKDRYEEIDGWPRRKNKFKEAVRDICRVISPGSDFSGEMYNHVKKLRENDYPWLQEILSR